ncbi:hypothetical protein [Sphingomonas sp. 2378]
MSREIVAATDRLAASPVTSIVPAPIAERTDSYTPVAATKYAPIIASVI